VLQQMKEFTVETEDGDATGSGGLFGALVISKPDEFRNRSFTSHLVELPWTEKLLTQRVEESFYAGEHMVFCRKHDDQLAIVSNIPYHHHHHYHNVFIVVVVVIIIIVVVVVVVVVVVIVIIVIIIIIIIIIIIMVHWHFH
jgi:hypothetical protein